MQDRLVSLLIFSIALSGLIDIGYSERTFDVLNYRAVGDGEADDSEAFVKAWKALCGAGEVGDVPTLVIPKGKTFLLQPIEFEGPCRPNRVHIQVLGNVVAPKTVDAWKECPSSNTWLQFTNVANLILDGSGTIDGQGSPWWSNSIANQYISLINVNEKSCERPRALHFSRCDNLRLSGLTHVNSPKAHIGINHCINVDVSHLTIIAPAESPNTDGIDISDSINVNIHDSFIGTGDDCIAINSGSSNINITNIACGPGHGISVGSLGKNGAHETVENVYVRDCSFNGTQNGARIKTWQGGSGYAKNIVFEKIKLVAAENPIIIDQFYCDAKAKLSCDNHQTSAVTVSEVRYIAFEGTSGSEEAITLNCNQIHGCQNIVMEEIHITSAVPSKKIYASCSHAKGTCNDSTVPVSCLDK